MIGRIVLAAVALALASGFAIELHAQALSGRAGKDVMAPRVSAAQLDRDLADLDSVSKLRPGAQAMLTAAGLDLKTHRFRAAARMAERAAVREPDNFAVWLTLGLARRAAGDEPGAKSAFARTHVLNPLYPTPR